jgi:alpha-tubulin suppressor-like RCC1 family protein
LIISLYYKEVGKVYSWGSNEFGALGRKKKFGGHSSVPKVIKYFKVTLSGLAMYFSKNINIEIRKERWHSKHDCMRWFSCIGRYNHYGQEEYIIFMGKRSGRVYSSLQCTVLIINRLYYINNRQLGINQSENRLQPCKVLMPNQRTNKKTNEIEKQSETTDENMNKDDTEIKGDDISKNIIIHIACGSHHSAAVNGKNPFTIIIYL